MRLIERQMKNFLLTNLERWNQVVCTLDYNIFQSPLKRLNYIKQYIYLLPRFFVMCPGISSAMSRHFLNYTADIGNNSCLVTIVSVFEEGL